jgi:hypothetical protein
LLSPLEICYPRLGLNLQTLDPLGSTLTIEPLRTSHSDNVCGFPVDTLLFITGYQRHGEF